MKLFKGIFLVIFSLSVITGCKKFLDVNSDPASPQTPDLASLMVPSTSVMSKMQVLDVITVGQYIQNWNSMVTGGDVFDVHGGNANGASANALWRSFYAQQGGNINLVLAKAIQDLRWDYAGAAVALRAWGLLMTTNYFGEMPYKQAWDNTRYTFTYDPQEVVYKAIDSLCINAIDYLQRKDGAVNQVSMLRGDRVYGGNTEKWIKFVYGIRARHWQHLTNKPNYNPDSVLYFVSKSFENAADNFLVTHTATRNDDTNPMGPGRDNFSLRRQSRFIVQLLDGTSFNFGTPNPTAPANRDPRLRGMLSVSPDTTTPGTNMPTQNGGYRFVIPSVGDPNNASTSGPTFRQRVSTFYGDSAIINPAINNFSAGLGKYLWRNSAPVPIMTYHELLFIKAEALFRKSGGPAFDSWLAYQAGIKAHFEFVDFLNSGSNPSISPIVPQLGAYLASTAVKQNFSSLTLTDIMLQKYIGDFGWNLVQSWSDMRRYHYFDFDPATQQQVYRNYIVGNITPIYSSNNQGPKPAYRYRPTNFSEFDWNFEELRKLGANNIDYHTYEMWFSKP